MAHTKRVRKNLIMYPLGTVGRDMVYCLFANFLLTFVLITKNLTPAQLTVITGREDKDKMGQVQALAAHRRNHIKCRRYCGFQQLQDQRLGFCRLLRSDLLPLQHHLHNE